jgi:hypothetical protein
VGSDRQLSSVVLRQRHDALLFDEIGIALGSGGITIETRGGCKYRQLTHGDSTAPRNGGSC